jgi:hypothetical protein
MINTRVYSWFGRGICWKKFQTYLDLEPTLLRIHFDTNSLCAYNTSLASLFAVIAPKANGGSQR